MLKPNCNHDPPTPGTEVSMRGKFLAAVLTAASVAGLSSLPAATEQAGTEQSKAIISATRATTAGGRACRFRISG